MSRRVLVTGATGFVGPVLCETLARSGYVVRAAVRVGRKVPESSTEHAVICDIDATTDWREALVGVDVVVHAAARAHVLNDTTDNDDRYRETNTRGTTRLAEAAAAAGVKRIVLLS